MTQALLVLLLAGPLQWSDGPRQREAWLDAATLAEIQPSDQGAAAVRAIDPQAVLAGGSTARVGLWRLSAANAAELLAKLEGRLPGHFAPVFHDQPNPASKLRVPAGGVLLWLRSGEQAAGLLEQRQLVLKQDFGGGTLLVESAPGAATLALAAALRADPRVKAATPNWWLRARRR